MTFWSRLRQEHEDTTQSVARNLEALLASKQGHAGVCPVFGLGDHDVYERSKSHIQCVAEDMLDQVARFEPRVASPQLRYAGREDSMWARFVLTGTIEGRAQRFTLLYHVMFRDVRVRMEPEG